MQTATRRAGAWLGVLMLAALTSAGPAPAAADENKPRNLAKEDPDLQIKINDAIDRGAAWLAACQKKDGTFGRPKGQKPSLFEKAPQRIGFNALVLYTLAHCGHDAKSPVVKKSVAWLRKKYASLYKGDHLRQASSYSLSLWVLALHTLYAQDGSDEAAAKKSRYASPKSKKKNPCGYPKWVRSAIKRTLDWMLKSRAEKGLFRYPGGLPGSGAPPQPPPGAKGTRRGPNYGGPEDLSCSQYVLLAFWVGTRCGYKVPEKTLEHIANRILEIQETTGPEVVRRVDPPPAKPGEQPESRYGAPSHPEKPKPDEEVVKDRARGFGYTPGDECTAAMTTAGLSSLMIVKAILDENYQLDQKLRKRVDQGIWDGIAWLQKNYSIKGNHPVDAEWHYYYLYGLERALVIASKQYLGKYDWYVDGAKLLLDEQRKEGYWSPAGSLGAHQPPGIRIPIADTCFALLFLKRAAFKPKRPVLKGPEVTGGEK